MNQKKEELKSNPHFHDEECPPRAPRRDGRVSFFIPSKESSANTQRVVRPDGRNNRRTTIFQMLQKPITTFTYSPSSKKEQNVSSIEMHKDRAYLLATACFDSRIFIICLCCSFITSLILHFDAVNSWQVFLNEGKSAVNIIGAFLSFALVFRTNICCKYQ